MLNIFLKMWSRFQSYKCFHLVVFFTQSAYSLNNTRIIYC